MGNILPGSNGIPGIGTGLGNIDILKGTDMGLFKDKGSYDKSTYTRKTRPDGTVVEKIRMNQKNSNVGVVDVETQGINLGDRALDIAVSEKATEDAVGFVDSIWGSKSAAGMIQQKRLAEVKLEQFRAQRDLQLQADAAQRRAAQNQTHQQSNDVARGLR